MPMETDGDRVDAAVLALLYLTLDRDGRAWKGFDWSVMNRLHDKGMILNPVGKAKSVLLTEEGIAESERLFREMFAKQFDVFERRLAKEAFALRNDRAPYVAECSSLSRILGMLTAAAALKRRRLSCTLHPRLKLFPIPQSKILDRPEHRN
jgi:hypothetical protein